MSRHNRRRSRGGRKHAAPSRTGASDSIMHEEGFATVGVPALSYAMSIASSISSRTPSPSPISDITYRTPQILPPNMPMPGNSAPHARVWHNRYAAWQARKQREEDMMRSARYGAMAGRGGDLVAADACVGGAASLMAYSNAPRIVDPEPDLSGDEADELDAKMMNYFDGLDWLV